jgi:hypothetical protein
MLIVFPIGVSVDPDRLRPHVDDVMWAAARVGIASEEKLALVLQLDKAQLHRQLSGDGHISLSRLAAYMPPSFWAHFGWRLSCRFGLPREARRAAYLAMALIGHNRTARLQARLDAAKAQRADNKRRSA